MRLHFYPVRVLLWTAYWCYIIHYSHWKLCVYILIESKLCTVRLKPFKPKVAFQLHHTVHCAEKIVSAHYACWFCVSRKGGTGGGGWSHPQGDMHMVAAGLGCKSAMVGTVWANSCSGCMDRHVTQGDMHMVAAGLGCESAMCISPAG